MLIGKNTTGSKGFLTFRSVPCITETEYNTFKTNFINTLIPGAMINIKSIISGSDNFIVKRNYILNGFDNSNNPIWQII